MRQVTAAVSLGMVLFAAGCNNWPHLRDNGTARVAPTGDAPKAAQLVSYLNDNAGRVQAVQCQRVTIDCKKGLEPIGLDGMLACQKPRNFRLKAKVIGQPAVDIGSNDGEFWYWISKGDPYVFHCSHEAMSSGQVRLPFPFQPDMIVAALGLGEYDPNKEYQVRASAQSLELIESGKSAQGQPVQKITVFNRARVSNNGQPQVTDYILRDGQGRDICRAHVFEVKQDRETGALLPTHVRINWPAEKLEMTLRMPELQVVNHMNTAQGERLFSRRDLSNLPSFDLARWAPDSPSGVSQTGGVQQSGGSMR